MMAPIQLKIISRVKQKRKPGLLEAAGFRLPD